MSWFIRAARLESGSAFIPPDLPKLSDKDWWAGWLSLDLQGYTGQEELQSHQESLECGFSSPGWGESRTKNKQMSERWGSLPRQTTPTKAKFFCCNYKGGSERSRTQEDQEDPPVVMGRFVLWFCLVTIGPDLNRVSIYKRRRRWLCGPGAGETPSGTMKPASDTFPPQLSVSLREFFWNYSPPPPQRTQYLTVLSIWCIIHKNICV